MMPNTAVPTAKSRPDPANPAEVPVWDIQTPVGAERDVSRHRQLRLRGWPSVAAGTETGEAEVAISCHGGNDPTQCLGIAACAVAPVEDLRRGVIDMMRAQTPATHGGTERAESALKPLP